MTNTLRGLDELLNLLGNLSPNIQKNVMRTAVFRAAQMFRNEVRAGAPVGDGDPKKGGRFAQYPTGTLKKSFRAVRGRVDETGAKAGIKGIFYARFVEFGHTLKTHGKTKGSRQVIGHVPANNFIQRAFEANQERAVEVVKEAILPEVKKQMEKAMSKMPKVR